MARPVDTQRRGRTLAAVTDYVLEHGLSDLSLRPLASALGTSTRMLLYDFSSKEGLVLAVLGEVRRRESALLATHLETSTVPPSDLVRTIWDWLASPERAPFLRLFFEVYVQAMNHPDVYTARGREMVTEWLDQLGSALADPGTGPADPVLATLVIAVLRGLALDRLATGEGSRTDQALERFVALMDPPGSPG
ncbi:MAG TPA: TetR/AcrR family transcriptional regulator [Acidimicrobiales bacterium]|nr:TetR/AcrR family transcriptional regulator [Acidimicrobiales bacterium]